MQSLPVLYTCVHANPEKTSRSQEGRAGIRKESEEEALCGLVCPQRTGSHTRPNRVAAPLSLLAHASPTHSLGPSHVLSHAPVTPN